MRVRDEKLNHLCQTAFIHYLAEINPNYFIDSLRHYFGSFGEVQDPVIMRDKDTSNPLFLIQTI